MPITLAFDVYGTLIDTHNVVSKLSEMIGEKAAAFSQTWRDKQLEYSFRRGLMQNYEHFGVCTSHALDYTCLFYQTDLSPMQREELLACYRTLPAFSDVEQGLATLKGAGHRLFAFSNGNAEAVEGLLLAAGIREYFLGVVSVDAIKTFKPNPATYAHFLRSAEATGKEAWLISSNPFDVIGAKSAGMNAAWVKRSSTAIFDPWGIDPDLVVASLSELDGSFTAP
jgi:2-haloacid dehalogenase